VKLRRRALLYAALALAVPLPALAITGAEPHAASLEVSAGLDNCGLVADQIVCKIDATWNEIPGADRYSASVTRADGSVVDYGDVGAGSASFWVPYVGNGTYTVEVSAWGTPPGEDTARVLTTEVASTGDDAGKVGVKRGDATAEPADAGGTDPAGDGEPKDPEGPPAPCDETGEEDPADEDDAPADGDASDTAQAGLGEDAAAGLEGEGLKGEGELPDEVGCPAESTTP
jgi:hypothetical protein